MKKKLINGQKLPPQFRTARIQIEDAPGTGNVRAEIDESNRVVKNVSVSSDEPHDRYYGTEILSHEPGAVNLSRVTSGASPLLFNHDRDTLIGKVSNPQLRDGKLYVDLKFSQSEAGVQMLKDLLDGILTECSIGYDVDKFEVDEKEETYLATKWTLYECSLVSIPADFTVGVGRAFEQEEKTVEIEKKSLDDTRRNENNDSQERENSHKSETPMKKRNFLFEADKGDNATTGTTSAEVTNAEQRGQQRGAEIERNRVNGINDLVKHFAAKGLGGRKIDTAEVAAQHIKEGKSVQDFKDAVMTGTFSEVKAIQTPDSDGKIEVVGERDKNGSKRESIGAQFVNSKDFQARGKLTGQRRDIAIETDIAILGIRGKVAMAERAGFTSSDLAAVNVQIQPQVLGLGMQRLTIMDMLAPGTIGAAALIYPRENSFGTVDGVAVPAASGNAPGMPMAGMVGERGLKPNWEPDLATQTEGVKKVAVTTKVPDEFMADFPAARSYIDNRLPFMVDNRTEQQILYGDGLGNNLKGIFTTAGVQTRAIVTTDDRTVADSLKKGLTDIEVGSLFEPDGYAFHPYDWETASLLKDSQGRYLMGGPFYIPYGYGVFMEMYTFWGKPVVKTTAVQYGRPVAGCWKLGAQYFMREGMRIEMTNANEDDFRRNLIMLRAEHRLLLATYRPACFLEFTGFPARS